MSAHPKPTTPVLLVGDAWHSTLAATRALRIAGYTPWLACAEPETYAARSRATAGTILVPDPNFDSEGFVRELAVAARRLSVAAVLPSAEDQLFALAGREDDFPGIALGASSPELIARATDKGLFPELAADAGLRTPPTAKIVLSDSETLRTFGFPAIVKPPRKTQVNNPDRSVSSAYFVSNERTAEEVLEAFPGGEGLVQQYIPGQLVSVVGVSWEGEVVCTMHQASVRIWPLRCGVSSYAETIPPNAALEQGVGRLLQEIGWSGLFQAQFIRSPRGEHYLIDLNPRMYGSLALAVAAGLNLPSIWADLLLGRQPEVVGYRVGTRYRHEEMDVRAIALMLVNGGEYRRALRGLVPRRNTTHAIFSVRDPGPMLTIVTKLARRLTR